MVVDFLYLPTNNKRNENEKVIKKPLHAVYFLMDFRYPLNRLENIPERDFPNRQGR
jgi:hypothetical protein